MSVIALHADVATWDKLHAAAQAEKSPMIKDQMYHLISTSKDPVLANRALDIAMTSEPGATNSAGMLDQVARLYPDLAFDFALAHLDQVQKFIDTTSASRYMPRLAEGSSEAAMIAKLDSYAKMHIAPSAMGSVKTALATISYQANVRSQRLPEIDSWLATRH
jgi:aminopeptidase N